MHLAVSRNLPFSIKSRCATWPLFSVSLPELEQAVASCERGEVVVGRFSPPLHTAYLLDEVACVLYRCVQPSPMRVHLRRALAAHGGVRLSGVAR